MENRLQFFRSAIKINSLILLCFHVLIMNLAFLWFDVIARMIPGPIDPSYGGVAIITGFLLFIVLYPMLKYCLLVFLILYIVSCFIEDKRILLNDIKSMLVFLKNATLWIFDFKNHPSRSLFVSLDLFLVVYITFVLIKLIT